MDQVPEQMDIGEFVRTVAIDEREALAYATWWWWERQKGTPEKWRKLKVRLWDLVVSELCANVYHVIITPTPELVFRDPDELVGVALTRGWIFRYEGGNAWTLVTSVDRDGWARYKQVYKELKAEG